MIVAPHRIYRGVDVRGGRNVVWIGGHITVNDKGMVNPAHRRGVLFRDNFTGFTSSDTSTSTDGRTIHMEGVLIDGDDLAEGIQLACPSAHVQLANVRVNEVFLRGADDRDGTGAYTVGAGIGASHPDIIQNYGGAKSLRIDGLTGRSAYQGLFLQEDEAQPGNQIGTPVHLRRVNLEAVAHAGSDDPFTYVGNAMHFVSEATSGRQYVDTGTVWVAHHPSSGKVRDDPNPRSGSGGEWWFGYRSGGSILPDPSPGTAGPHDGFYWDGAPDVWPTIATDALGSFASWPDALDLAKYPGVPAYRDLAGTGPAKVYIGAPPGGDYVPASRVGLGYTSPGYAT